MRSVLDMYDYQHGIAELYGTLQDDLSREVFWARLQADAEKEATINAESQFTGMLKLIDLRKAAPEKEALDQWRDRCKQLAQENKRVILYGTAFTGRFLARHLLSTGVDFYGFCGRSAEKFPHGLMGKPVVTPQWLIESGRDCYVIITATKNNGSYQEIESFLRQSDFPEAQILSSFWEDCREAALEWVRNFQYFEFPELYEPGTAFIDGGCLDGDSSIRFSKMAGKYSKIFAFEPDTISKKLCEANMSAAGLHDFQVIEAGLSNRIGTAEFFATHSESSFVLSEHSPEKPLPFSGEYTSIRTVILDDIVGNETVGFIKMDIEGAEYGALHGAERTIRRDRPLLAICVYHRPGDLLAIMDYCHRLIPEYRFWLRHYYMNSTETVLYASIKSLTR